MMRSFIAWFWIFYSFENHWVNSVRSMLSDGTLFHLNKLFFHVSIVWTKIWTFHFFLTHSYIQGMLTKTINRNSLTKFYGAIHENRKYLMHIILKHLYIYSSSGCNNKPIDNQSNASFCEWYWQNFRMNKHCWSSFNMELRSDMALSLIHLLVHIFILWFLMRQYGQWYIIRTNMCDSIMILYCFEDAIQIHMNARE